MQIFIVIVGLASFAWLTRVRVQRVAAGKSSGDADPVAATPSATPSRPSTAAGRGLGSAASSDGGSGESGVKTAAAVTPPSLRVGPSSAKFATIPLEQSKNQVNEWQARADAMIGKALASSTRKRPVGAGPFREGDDIEKLQKWYDQAQVHMTREGYLHTLPAADQDRYMSQVQSLRREIEEGGDKPESYLKLAKLHEEVHMDSAVSDTLYTAMQKFPENPRVLMARASYFHRYGYRRQAEDMYKRLLEIAPENTVAKEALQQVENTLDYLPEMSP